MDKYFKRRFPNYFDDSDYQTNAPSYYDDLARKQKLIQLLAEKIWEYENTLNETLEQIEKRLTDYILENDLLMNERLENWDQRIDEMPEEMRTLFVTWLNDGTLEQIINHDVLGYKADKSYVDDLNENVTTQLANIVVNVRNFEHLVNGDDWSTAVQTAVDSFNGNDGVLFFPMGNYFIGGKITLKNKLTITGNKAELTTDQVILFEGVGLENVTIENIIITGGGWDLQGLDSTEGLISISESKHITIADCEVTNASTSISIIYCDDITITSNHIHHYGTHGLILSRSNRFIVSKNRIHDTLVKDGPGTYCITATGGGVNNYDTDYNIISDNILYNNEYWSAFMSHNIKKLIISNNHIFNARNGIDLSSSSEIQDVIISGNYIEGTNVDVWEDSPASNHGLMLVGTNPEEATLKNINITGNIIKNFGLFRNPQVASGIILQNVDMATVQGNIIEQVEGVSTLHGAITVSRNSKNINISANTTRTTGVDGVKLFQVTGGNISVMGNVFESGSRIPIKLTNCNFDKLTIKNNTTTAIQSYIEEGTNIINGVDGGGFGEANSQTLRVPSEDITVEPGELLRVQFVSFENGSMTGDTLFLVTHSKINREIEIFARQVDSHNVAIEVRNHGSTTFTSTGGTISIKAIKLS